MILQMKRVHLQGPLRSFNLVGTQCALLETSQSLFVSGTRRPKSCTVAIPLEEPIASSLYRAKGILVEWPALIGYDRHYRDFDLKLPAGTRLTTIFFSKDVLLEQLKRRRGSHRTPERWDRNNNLN